jgi:hypothetical protein
MSLPSTLRVPSSGLSVFYQHVILWRLTSFTFFIVLSILPITYFSIRNLSQLHTHLRLYAVLTRSIKAKPGNCPKRNAFRKYTSMSGQVQSLSRVSCCPAYSSILEKTFSWCSPYAVHAQIHAPTAHCPTTCLKPTFTSRKSGHCVETSRRVNIVSPLVMNAVPSGVSG